MQHDDDANERAPAPAPAPFAAASDAPPTASSTVGSAMVPAAPSDVSAASSGESNQAAATDSSDDCLHLHLKTLDERVFDVHAASSMSVVDFRAKVALVTEVPPPRQRLIYRGKLMKDGAALATYDVQDGHTVHLVAKPAASTTASPPSAPATSTASTSTQDTRERLRGLMGSVSDWDDPMDGREGSTTETGRVNTNTGLLPPRTDRPRMVTRLREPRGTAWNLATLRDALSNDTGSRTTGTTTATNTRARTTPGRQLPMLSELLEEMEESPQETAASMGLGALPTHLDRNSRTNLSSSGRTRSTAPSGDMESIAQGILTMRTLLSTVALGVETQEGQEGEQQEQTEVMLEEQHQQSELNQEQAASGRPRVRRGHRQFFVGQWLDVKDTVNQWLESTVMDIADGKVLVHYHGWPTRWDEWLDFDSDRIAAFRTRTLHTLDPQRMSPTPTTRVPTAPRVSENNVRRMVVDVRDLMRQMMPHIERLADLCEEEQTGENSQRTEQQSGSLVPPVESEGLEHTQDAAVAEEEVVVSPSTEARQTHDDEVSEVAHLVAPLFDRFGRLLMDSVRHFDPLLRPELRISSQRQQQRRSTAFHYGRDGSAMERRAANTMAAMEEQDTSLSIRDLIATSPRSPRETNQPRHSIDVHIHAVVSPASLSSFASLAQGSSGLAESTRAGTTIRRIPRSSTRPVGRAFDEAFGLPEVPNLVTAQDIQNQRRASGNPSGGRPVSGGNATDQSREPLLGSYRRHNEPHSTRTEASARRRTVEENLDEFLADDFFGTSFGGDSNLSDEENADDDDSISSGSGNGATHTALGTMGTPPSPYNRIPSPRTPPSQEEEFNSGSTGIGVIPEIAEAEERERQRTQGRETNRSATQHGDEGGRTMGESSRGSADSSASADSSTSASSTGFPTFLEVMRRTLSGVRGFGFSSNASDSTVTTAGETSTNVALSSPSSSSSSSPPASSAIRSFPEGLEGRRNSANSEGSSIEEDLDEVD